MRTPKVIVAALSLVLGLIVSSSFASSYPYNVSLVTPRDARVLAIEFSKKHPECSNVIFRRDGQLNQANCKTREPFGPIELPGVSALRVVVNTILAPSGNTGLSEHMIIHHGEAVFNELFSSLRVSGSWSNRYLSRTPVEINNIPVFDGVIEMTDSLPYAVTLYNHLPPVGIDLPTFPKHEASEARDSLIGKHVTGTLLGNRDVALDITENSFRGIDPWFDDHLPELFVYRVEHETHHAYHLAWAVPVTGLTGVVMVDAQTLEVLGVDAFPKVSSRARQMRIKKTLQERYQENLNRKP